MITPDYRELIANDDIQAVSICLPDHLHREVTIAAAEAGKHILCEKPLSLTLDEADDMLSACERNGVQLGLVMNHRYAPGNILAKRAVDSGALGRPLIGSVLHSSGLKGDPAAASPWRGRRNLSTGGVLSTQAIHFLDLLLWLGGPATAVQAWTDRLASPDQEHEDTVGVVLKLASGAVATLSATSASPIMDDFTGTRIELHGTGGYVVLEGDELRTAELADGPALTPPNLPPIPSGIRGDHLRFRPRVRGHGLRAHGEAWGTGADPGHGWPAPDGGHRRRVPLRRERGSGQRRRADERLLGGRPTRFVARIGDPGCDRLTIPRAR